jgi:hypothetical protein
MATKHSFITPRVQLTSAVSQFTLHATLKKGNKPDFHQSASGDKARTFYQMFYDKVGELYDPEKVKNGVFAAMMDVALVNDGPVSGQCESLTQRHPLPNGTRSRHTCGWLTRLLGHYSDRYKPAQNRKPVKYTIRKIFIKSRQPMIASSLLQTATTISWG